MIIDGFVHQLPDIDPDETEEWLDSLDAVVERQRADPGPVPHVEAARAQPRARRSASRRRCRTPYVNTIPADSRSRWFPGDEDIERRIRAYIRWNAAVMVVKANKRADGIGGHLSTFASLRRALRGGLQPLLPGQGRRPARRPRLHPGPRRARHLRPGLPRGPPRRGPARPLPPGDRRRTGLSQLPAPPADARLLGVPDGVDGPRPDQLDLPGPVQPLPAQPPHRRHRAQPGVVLRRRRRVRRARDARAPSRWPAARASTTSSGSSTATCSASTARCGATARSSRSSRPSSGAPAGTSSRSSGARQWDELLARDVDGVLLNKMNTTVDGEFQRYAVESGAYIREHFFGPDPRLRKLVEHLPTTTCATCPAAATTTASSTPPTRRPPSSEGAPTVILAKTIKGWTLGPDVEGRNATHQIKKMTTDAAHGRCATGCTCRTRSPTRRWPTATSRRTIRPAERLRRARGTCIDRRARARRLAPHAGRPHPTAAGPARPTRRSPSCSPGRASRRRRPPRRSPACCATCAATRSSAAASCRSSPTRPAPSAWTRCSRSSGSTPSQGQQYEPVDHDLLLSYKESTDGQILEEGITEAGGLASGPPPARPTPPGACRWCPFFIFYSMFGFQRVGDLIWAAADARARGFLLGATAGRTTLLGEGLQHQDGHSLVLASHRAGVPGLRPGLRLRDGRHRPGRHRPHVRPRAGEDVFYYLTLYNENYVACRRWPTASTARASSRACTAGPARRDGPRPRATDPVLRHRPRARRRRRPGASWPSTTASAPSCGAPRATSGSARRPSRSSAGTGSTRPRTPATPRVTELLGRRRARSWPSPTSCGGARPDRPVGARAASRSLGTDGFGRSATPARRCAATSRPTPAHVVVAVLSGLAAAGAIEPRRGRQGHAPATASTPTWRRPGPAERSGAPRPG